jgi:hypothetical protein
MPPTTGTSWTIADMKARRKYARRNRNAIRSGRDHDPVSALVAMRRKIGAGSEGISAIPPHANRMPGGTTSRGAGVLLRLEAIPASDDDRRHRRTVTPATVTMADRARQGLCEMWQVPS